MTNIELEALRRLLFFSQAEAADLIGQCAHRTWQRWESGDRNVPCRIADAIVELIGWRNAALATMRSQIARAASAHGMPDQIELVWYGSIDKWVATPGPAGEKRAAVHWRPHQSVVAQLYAEHSQAALIMIG